MKKSWFVAALLLLIALPFLTVQACGPDFAPDVFVRSLRPDQPKEFTAGELGVLLPTFPRNDLIVAFRYLNGGVLSAKEQAAYEPTYTMLEPERFQQSNAENQETHATALNDWASLRAKYDGVAPNVSADKDYDAKTAAGYTYQSSYLNCNHNAFHTAALTLTSRAQTWGAQSAALTDWLHGQDAVFANCSGKVATTPQPAPADAPALLKADRAYQEAAALFYAGRLEDARKAFAAIGDDSNSPWQGIAGYLQARCLVREAFLASTSTETDGQTPYDPTLMNAAAELLLAQLKERHPGISQAAIESELNLIRIRTEPLVRLNELGIALAGPATDPNYAQNLKDITWFLDGKLDSIPIRQDMDDYALRTAAGLKGPDASITDAQRESAFANAYKLTGDLRASSPLVDWAITFQSPAAEAKTHAMATWEETPTLYWLVAAMTKADGKDVASPRLIAAATKIEKDSPAWETVTYHRARLLIESGKVDEARDLLDQSLPALRSAQRDSSVNLYQDLRMTAARNLNEFLTYAPQKVLARTSEASSSSDECLSVMQQDPKRRYDCALKIDADQFSNTAAAFFNHQAPLSVLVDAAKSNTLPLQLRQAVAIMAWTRSILLNDHISAKDLLPWLPGKVRQQAGPGYGFPALVTIARNPGLRPYLEAGVQRSYSYDFVESYRDNWWCRGLEPSWAASPAPFRSELVAFLTTTEREKAAKELSTLDSQDTAKLYVGNLILNYVRDHSDAPNAPEALYLILRMIRYGCDRQLYTPPGTQSEETKNIDALKRDVARLMRERYANSPWTQKAAPLVR